jgi:hypothetical protein
MLHLLCNVQCWAQCVVFSKDGRGTVLWAEKQQ